MILFFTVILLGIGFLGHYPKNNPLFLRLCIGPAIGILTFTTTLLYLSFLLNFKLETILAALLITALLSVFFFVKSGIRLKLDFPSKIFIFTAAFVFLVVSYLMISQTLFKSHRGIESGGAGLYGDSALHAAYTSRIEIGVFPPQNPLFANKILVYPFANDLFSAALKKFGLPFNFAFVLPQIAFLLAFLILFFQIVKKVASDFGGVLTLPLLFFGWGIGAILFFQDISIRGWAASALTRDYTNLPEYNLHLHNIITGLILPERSFLPGLVIGLLIFLLIAEYIESGKVRLLLISGVLLGILPFWHTHTFIFYSLFSLVMGSWIIVKTKNAKTIRDLTLMVSVSLLFALPFIILFLSNHSPDSFLRMTFGWQIGDENIIVFWLKNSFLIIPLSILGFLTIAKDKRIYFIPAFIAFLISNFIIFQPWEWDNIKIISWSFLFFSILSAVALEKIFKRNHLYKILVILIILLSTASGFLSLNLQFKNKYVIYDENDIALADWTKSNTNSDDIFIIEPTPNHPVPGLAGRVVYMGYPGHLWVHGIDYLEREKINEEILNGTSRPSKIEGVSISYIVLPALNPNLNFGTMVFQNQKYKVFKSI